jgi:hypothetical protein
VDESLGPGAREARVTQGSTDEALGDKHNVSLILRLVLDRDGGLQQGEVVDAFGRSAGRFHGWESMVATVRLALVVEGVDTDRKAEP